MMCVCGIDAFTVNSNMNVRSVLFANKVGGGGKESVEYELIVWAAE